MQKRTRQYGQTAIQTDPSNDRESVVAFNETVDLIEKNIGGSHVVSVDLIECVYRNI